MTDFTTYTTKPGDRWDLIAFRAYGDCAQMTVLIAANRAAGIPVVLPANVLLRIPILPDTDLLSPDLLPPWKQ